LYVDFEYEFDLEPAGLDELQLRFTEQAAIQIIQHPKFRAVAVELALANVVQSVLAEIRDDIHELGYYQYLKQSESQEEGEVKVSNPFCPLLIADEWDTTKGGISSWNMQLARGLAKHGIKVYVGLVINELDEARMEDDELKQKFDKLAQQIQSAAADKIVVVDSLFYQGIYTPQLRGAESCITHIIGHAHVTGVQATRIQQQHQFNTLNYGFSIM